MLTDWVPTARAYNAIIYAAKTRLVSPTAYRSTNSRKYVIDADMAYDKIRL